MRAVEPVLNGNAETLDSCCGYVCRDATEVDDLAPQMEQPCAPPS